MNKEQDGAKLLQGNQQRMWGTDTYSKWDDLDSDSESDEGQQQQQQTVSKNQKPNEITNTSTTKTPMHFSLGAVDFVPINELHIPANTDLKRTRALPQHNTEVWQVGVRKLRVWAASGSGEPCRPYCVFVTCIYPKGEVVTQDVAVPPETQPTPERIMELLLRGMLKPPTGEQRRPGKVTFVQSELGERLFNSLAKIGIEASPLSEAEGVNELVKVFSESLVKRDIARRGQASENPGILSGDAMSPRIASALFSASSDFAESAPWEVIPERECFQLSVHEHTSPISVKQDSNSLIETAEITNKLDDSTVTTGTVWVSIIGESAAAIAAEKEAEAGQQEQQSSRGTFGIAIFFSRLDLEARVAPAGYPVHRSESEADTRCSFTNVTAKQLGHELKRTKPRKYDVRTGLELQYADAQALRAHWPSVRTFAKPLTERDEGLKAGRQHWMPYEATMLLENPTVVPFDDHEGVDKHGWRLPDPKHTSLGSDSMPLFLELKDGQVQRPGAVRALWLERALKASVALRSKVKEDRKLLRRTEEDAELKVKSDVLGGVMELLVVRGSPVFLQAEVDAARKSAMEAANR